MRSSSLTRHHGWFPLNPWRSLEVQSAPLAPAHMKPLGVAWWGASRGHLGQLPWTKKISGSRLFSCHPNWRHLLSCLPSPPEQHAKQELREGGRLHPLAMRRPPSMGEAGGQRESWQCPSLRRRAYTSNHWAKALSCSSTSTTWRCQLGAQYLP